MCTHTHTVGSYINPVHQLIKEIVTSKLSAVISRRERNASYKGFLFYNLKYYLKY